MPRAQQGQEAHQVIRTIRGNVSHADGGSIIIETSSGIGFRVFIPSGSSFFKMSDGEEAAVYTAMIVKEDDISLYGFDSKDDLVLFELLITVSGIGAKGAMSIMSTLRADDLRRAIATGDAKTISKANGVGKKTAERLILELKDKIGSFEAVEEYTVLQDEIEASDEKTEAVYALVSLGYTRNEALAAVSKVKGDGYTVEDYIKQALKSL